MKEITGNLFDINADAICITTNGFVKRDGCNVMGMGCAKEALTRYPTISRALGTSIKKYGNQVAHIGMHGGINILAFPVKPTSGISDGNNVVRHAQAKHPANSTVPGFLMKADPAIIQRSAEQLRRVADGMGWTTVVLPRPGCGAGELQWADIKPILADILDDRFYSITFK